MHVGNKNKDILGLGEGLTQGLDKTATAVVAKYPIDFTQSGKRFLRRLKQFLVVWNRATQDTFYYATFFNFFEI